MAGGELVAADGGDRACRGDAGVALTVAAGDRTLRWAAVTGAAILILAGLWAARGVMTPVAFALFVIALVWPLQRRLVRVLPQLLALAITLAVALLVIGAAGWLVFWAFGDIAHWVIANAARLQGLYMHAADLLEQRGLYAAELFAEQINVRWLVQVLRAIGGSLQDVLSFAIVTFVFLVLGLLEVEPVGRRLGGIGDGNFGETASEIASRLQTYMLVRFAMSVLTGLGFWGVTAALGLDLSREWGVLAFVLNFLPFIGSFVATLLPTLLAAAQFESLSSALIVFAGLNLVQFFVGSYIEPRLAGRAVAISPFMVLFAVFFWGMLWGIAGAFIGVPILIALVTLCARHPSTAPIATVLSPAGPGSREPLR
jgi:predicted PurR-regulated permease PerM